MGILDDLIINVKSAFNAVGKRAEKVIDVSKLRYAESGLHNEVNKKLKELGSFVYESYVAGEMDKKALGDMIGEIKELQENIESTRELINAQRDRVKCKFCGEFVNADLKYCGKCGAKLYDDYEADNGSSSGQSVDGVDVDDVAKDSQEDFTPEQ